MSDRTQDSAGDLQEAGLGGVLPLSDIQIGEKKQRHRCGKRGDFLDAAGPPVSPWLLGQVALLKHTHKRR